MVNNNENIIQIMKKLITLLENNNGVEWALVFKQLLHEYCDIEKRNQAVRDILSTYMGGMGSFDDFIFQELNIKEQDAELEKLKIELHHACKLHLLEQSEKNKT